jgi:hypothetical protein
MLSQIIEQIPFSIKVSEEEVVSFKELRIKKEHFFPQPTRPNYNIINTQILNNLGQKSMKDIDLNAVEAYSLQVETVTSSTAIKRVITRVCLVTETGDRVLDTLVQPPSHHLTEDGKCDLIFKEQIKTKLLQLAADCGPSITQVTKSLVKLMEGKKIVGYHLPIILKDVGIVSNVLGLPFETLSLHAKDIVNSKFASIGTDPKKHLCLKTGHQLTLRIEDMHDIAKIFNREGNSQI